MVKGLDLFREHFADYADQYCLIGGTACSVLADDLGLGFRVTKDLDIVLCIEALSSEFGKAFWAFIEAGRYEIIQKSNGTPCFYRFVKPQDERYPAMLEVFSRRPDWLPDLKDGSIVPIPIGEDTPSLSAIIMNDEYYRFVISGAVQIDGLSIVDALHLIPLKASAFLDLTQRKTAGEDIDSRNIQKHFRDVFRLYTMLMPNVEKKIFPPSIQSDIEQFIAAAGKLHAPLKELGIKSISQDEILLSLKRIYCSADSLHNE